MSFDKWILLFNQYPTQDVDISFASEGFSVPLPVDSNPEQSFTFLIFNTID